MQTLIAEEDKCPQLCKYQGIFKKVSIPVEKIPSTLANKTEELEVLASHARPSEPSQTDNLPPTSSCPEKEGHSSGLNVFPDGKIDWTSLPQLTGIRPDVSKYSFTRYSLDEWKRRNEETLSPEVIYKSNAIDYDAQTAITAAFGKVDRRQTENKMRLKQRAKELHKWKEEVKVSCEAISKEVLLLEAERQRLKSASRTLMLPESISRECLELRCLRSEPDLVSDLVEIELKKELELVAEVRSKLTQTLKKIEEQLDIDKKAKRRIEVDWCDKNSAHENESINLGLSSRSNTIIFRQGATRFSDFTANLEQWEYYCRENIADIEAVRQRSMDLRGSISAILIDGGKKLRIQADKTDIALGENVSMTQELCGKLELTLQNTLQRIADMEKLIDKLNDSIRKMDSAMKLAQTRLDNRNHFRAHNECVKDKPQIGLMHEVKLINESVTSLRLQLNNTMKVREELMEKRKVLERDIASKRMSLCIDRDRCGLVRLHYPSASELAGF